MATMTDEELTFHYHTRYCSGDCAACDPNPSLTHHDVAMLLDDVRPNGYPGAEYARERQEAHDG